jgi:hypothetical protein
MNARKVTLDNGRTLITFSEKSIAEGRRQFREALGLSSHTDDCSGEHDETSGACEPMRCDTCGEAHKDWECPDHKCFDCVHRGAR